MRRPTLLIAALIGAAASAAAPPAGRDHAIPISGMHFGAPAGGLMAGDTIVWINRDIVVHSATARDRSFDVTLQPHQSVRVTLRRPGRIAFYCRFHPAMQGVLAVAPR